MNKRNILRFFLFFIFLALFYGAVYLWRALPIISGFGAKELCSCAFVSGRNPEDVIRQELSFKPVSFGSYSINMADSSATGKVLGLAVRKAIFRKGLGCTMTNGISKEALRAQKFQIAGPPADPNKNIIWPTGDSLPLFDSSLVNFKNLENVIQEAFTDTGSKSTRRTRAVIILYDGKMVVEKYAPGISKDTRLTGWSMAKSITNALIGMLVKQGKLKVESTTGFEAWKDDDRKNITIDQLLHANSGLKWEEVYTGPSSVTNMLYKEKDMAAFAIKSTLVDTPGTHFNYSSGTSNMLSYIVRQKIGDGAYYKFPYEELFYKLGMYSAILEPDPSGTFVGSSYCFATARDWARFGLLYFNDGTWNGERLLPEGWVRYTTTASKGALRKEYGAQFWLNAGDSVRTYPDVPGDCFFADGYAGQNVWIIPSKKLVVVRLACQTGSKLDENRFLADIIKCLH